MCYIHFNFAVMHSDETEESVSDFLKLQGLRQNLGLLIFQGPGRVRMVRGLSAAHITHLGLESGMISSCCVQSPGRCILHQWTWSQLSLLATALPAGLMKTIVFLIKYCLMQLF